MRLEEVKLTNGDRVVIEVTENPPGTPVVQVHLVSPGTEAVGVALRKQLADEGVIIDDSNKAFLTSPDMSEVSLLATAPAGTYLVKELSVGGGYDDSWQEFGELAEDKKNGLLHTQIRVFLQALVFAPYVTDGSGHDQLTTACLF